MRSQTTAKLTLLLLAGISACLPGCLERWTNRDQFGPSAACRISQPMDGPQLVQFLNENGPAKLHAWKADRVTISVRGAPMSLRASLAVQAPRNFRLTGGAFGIGDDVDFGSNDERFWFWVKQSEKPFVYTARHDQLAVAKRLPFQPDWVIEALGVTPIDDKDIVLEHVANAPRGRRWGKLVSQRVSPQGAPVHKETLVDLCHGIILQHALFDAQGNLIAKANMADHHTEQMTGAVIPHRIELEWPMTNMALTLQLGPVLANPQVSAQMFALPTKPNCPVMDLGRSTAGVRPLPRPQHQPISLTGELEEEAPLPSAPAFQPTSNPGALGRVGFRQEPEQLLK